MVHSRVTRLAGIASLCAIPLLFASLAPAQDKEPTADEIVAKHIDARGGADKMKALKTAKITGKMVMMGGQMEAPFTLTIARPFAMRMEMEIQGKSLVQAFDGTTAWMINPFMGGNDPEKMSEEDSQQMRDDADFDGPLVDYKTKGHTVDLVGKEDVEGTSCYKLKIAKKTGKTDYSFIDAQSFLEIKSITKQKMMGQEMEMEVYPTNYKPVAGVLTPFTTERKSGGRSVMTMTFDKVEPNIAVDEAKFKFPAKEEKAKEEKK